MTYRLKSMKSKIVNYTFLALALLFIIAGIAQGGYMDTMQRAIFICLECIGIG
jgi:hypothetical protein